MKQLMKLVATLWVVVLACSFENVSAQPGSLEPAEADAVEWLYLFAELKKDYFERGSDVWEKPALLALANDEQHTMDVLGSLATTYHVQISDTYWGCNTLFWDWDELDFYCGILHPTPDWAESWEVFVSTAAYFEELSIRELKKAIDKTTEETLENTWPEILDLGYAHLLYFASLLYDDPLDYEAQLLSQADVDLALAEAIANSSEEFVINSGLNDVWYDPATDGQGFSISVFEDKGIIFLAWFTYDTELPAGNAIANLGDAGQRWLVAQGAYEGKRAELVTYSSVGGVFAAPSPLPERIPIGSIVLQFEDCNTATVTYEFPGIGRSGSIPIERLVSDNIARCEFNRLAAPLPTEAGVEHSAPSSGSCYVSEGAVPTTFKRLFAVWGRSSSDIFAATNLGPILHYDGTRWSVWGSSPDNAITVGDAMGNGLISHFDGIDWKSTHVAVTPTLQGVWGSSADDIFAVGGGRATDSVVPVRAPFCFSTAANGAL